MSSLSGYDSEAVGFDSVRRSERPAADGSTQTTEFHESGTATQTATGRHCGTQADPHDLQAGEDLLKEYPPPGLNEFLRKVVPGVLEQLDINDAERGLASSDSEEEEGVAAKLFQKLELTDAAARPSIPATILDVSWSSAGNSLAVSVGCTYHEQWCLHEGVIKIFTIKRTEGDKFVHLHDIHEKSCVSVVAYHPAVAALLAYGTCAGEVTVCSLRSIHLEDGARVTSPSNCHGSERISCLHWADPALASSFLALKLTGKRRGASDQVLVTAGSDGRVNVWQVNLNLNVFESIISYRLNGVKKTPAVDITCFDFIKTYTLRAVGDDETFVVGTKSGQLLACKTKSYQAIVGSTETDPVCETLEGHSTCVLSVSFILERAGVFVSLSTDSELRMYDVTQKCPLKVIQLDECVSCAKWVRGPLVAVGGRGLRLYHVAERRAVAVEGWSTAYHGRGDGDAACVTSLALQHSSVSRFAVGDDAGAVTIWDVPISRIKLKTDSLQS